MPNDDDEDVNERTPLKAAQACGQAREQVG
jgi:hypothetical protein